ncbi:prepilin peptidase [Granulicella arctica]|uniref:prepilin peptidase n=1 Tax=Granulicella arctica TaxID=940613 RepID=UPI0021E0E05F|nr:A24 family peptidase [Granulicella arctica]
MGTVARDGADAWQLLVQTYTSEVNSPYLFEVAGLVLGLLLGSFLNVCISRVPQGESVVRPGSRCGSCGKAIRWYDNVPLLSWVVLRGRCRDCCAAISWRYPAVELAVGVWFAVQAGQLWEAFSFSLLSAGHMGTAFDVASQVILHVGLAVLGWLLIGLLVMDWQTMLLPDAFTFSGMGISFLLVCVQAVFLGPTEDQVILGAHHLRLASPGNVVDHGNVFLTGPENMLGTWLVATVGAAAILLMVRWLYKVVRHREGMGLGDVKLLAMMGAFLGFWPAVLSLFLGVVLASAYSIVLLVRRRAGGATRVPLGSFLAMGGLITALVGSHLIDTYKSFLR